MTDGGSAASLERRPDWPTLIIALLLILAGAIVAWDAARMRSGVAAYSRVGPRAFPFGIAAGLVLLGLCTAIQALRRSSEHRDHHEFAPIAWIIGGLIAQLALLRPAGFAIATGAVFAATAKGFGRGPLWFTYLVGFLMSLAMWLFFSMGLKLVLPAGPIEAATARAAGGVWASLAALF